MGSPFHAGEVAVQARAGVRGMAERVGRSIHDALAPSGGAFLAERRFVVLGGADGDGRVWASWIEGSAGFARATDAHTVTLGAHPAQDDPLAPLFGASAPAQPRVALLAIDLEHRRRLRVNGTCMAPDRDGFRMRVSQAYWNCPKYIQRRVPIEGGDAGEIVVHEDAALDEPGRRLVAAADTFFVASLHPTAGTDVSHRGGEPGFVQLDRDGDGDVLAFPDYAGNTMFNTLGNVLAQPRVGLLFVDFRRGTTLQLTGTAELAWDGALVERFPGAERAVRVRVERARTRRPGTTLRWRLVERSPYNPPAGPAGA